jgi:hypothetical protein
MRQWTTNWRPRPKWTQKTKCQRKVAKNHKTFNWLKATTLMKTKRWLFESSTF